VAFAGLLEGLAAYTLLSGNEVPLGPRIVAALALADTVARDIHGLPFLASLILGAVWLRRHRAPQVSAGAGHNVTGYRAPSPCWGLKEQVSENYLRNRRSPDEWDQSFAALGVGLVPAAQVPRQRALLHHDAVDESTPKRDDEDDE
jgi:hypothetical protein